MKPRLIVHGVPAALSSEEVLSDIIKLNLPELENPDVKVIYMSRENRDSRACVIEVTAEIRTILKRRQRLYLRFSSCRFDDHVKVLQCYKCLAFGHLSKDCKNPIHCAHCSGDHEAKACKNGLQDPVCYNCKTVFTDADCTHNALDGKCCPILSKRIADKARNTDYG